MAFSFSADGPQVFEESGEGDIVLSFCNVPNSIGALVSFDKDVQLKLTLALLLSCRGMPRRKIQDQVDLQELYRQALCCQHQSYHLNDRP